MPLIASELSSGPRTLAPTGTHVARCVQVIDLGTQDDTYMGEPKITHKVRITWELPYELHVFDEKKGEQPFFLSKKYTLNLGEKANLTKDLISWRGRMFTAEELKGFDLKNVLGAPCQLSVIHKKGANSDKVREEISAVTTLAKGMTCPEAISELLYFEVGMGRNSVYNSLPSFLREEIAKCHEWRERTEDGQGNSNPFNQEEGETDSEVPF